MIIILRKFYSILESKQNRFIFLLIVLLSVIGAALEMLSIGLIVPIVSSLNNQYISNNYLNYIFSFVAISEDKIILLLLILLILIFIFKTVFFTFFSFINAKFSADLNSNISSRIFNNYIYQDYSFFLKRGSSSLIQNINIEISNFINIFFASLLVFLNEIITLFGISIILIYISPISFFIFVFIIGIFSIFFVNSVSKLLKKWGHQRQLYQLTSLRQLQEGIRNIKDLKINNLENKFYKYFSSQIRLFSNVEKYVNFLSVIPRYYIELIGVLFFVLVINVFILLSYSNEKIIIILSVFSLSALKILPSVNRIINSIIKLKYSHVSLEAIYRDINLRVPNSKNLSYKKKLIILNKKLILKKVSYYYENRNKFILKNVNIKIKLTGKPEDLKILEKSLSYKLKLTNMHAFNSKNVIHKYESFYEILQEFVNVRLELYLKRKDIQLKLMKDKLPYHENVVRFIQQQSSESPFPDLRRKPIQECELLLEKDKFTNLNGYDYLLDLPIRSLTLTNATKHQNEYESLKQKIKDLESKSEKDLWLNDLELFEKNK